MVPGNTEKEHKQVEHAGQATSEEGSSKPAITTATAASLHWGHRSQLSPLKGELGCVYTDYRPPLVEVPVPACPVGISQKTSTCSQSAGGAGRRSSTSESVDCTQGLERRISCSSFSLYIKNHHSTQLISLLQKS